jgi:hypothetical protein
VVVFNIDLSDKAIIFVENTMKNPEIFNYILYATSFILAITIIIIMFAKSMFKAHTQTIIQMVKIESLKNNNEALGKLKLQAYERLSILLERTSIPTLIQTFGNPNTTPAEFKILAMKSIQEEFNYNLSQQVYVSEQTWNMIKIVKEQTMIMLQQVERTVDPLEIVIVAGPAVPSEKTPMK